MKKLLFGIFTIAASVMLFSAHSWAEDAIKANSKPDGQKYNIVVNYVQSAAFLKDDESEKYLIADLQFPLLGGEIVKSISYRYTINGKTTTRQADIHKYYTEDHPYFSRGIKLPFDNLNQPGSYEMEFEILQVNNKDYIGEYGKAIGYVDILDKKPICRPLCEMIISSNDYDAPLGFEQFISTKEHRGYEHSKDGSFVGVIYHYDDPMRVAELKDLPIPRSWDGTQIPFLFLDSISYSLDRTLTRMPTYNYKQEPQYDSYYENRVSPVGISSTAQYVKNEVSDVKVSSTVEFFCTRKNANYKLGYVVTGDNLSGEGEEWALHNGYTITDPKVGSFNNLPSIIYNYTYDDVALITKYIYGVDESLPSEIHSGDKVNFDFTIPASDITDICNMSGERLPVKYDRLSVISFVIDTTTGEILNACSNWLGDPAGVGEVESAETIAVDRFDINGNRVDENYKGLCIVRETKADGTVSSRKEMIR